MITPSPDIILLLRTFAKAMTAPTFANALILLYGTLLAPGRRTITAALRVLGLVEGSTFGKYHRVLSRAEWSPLVLSRLLLGLLVTTFVAEEAPLVLVIDETLERRCGKQIVYKGRFYDAVRSTAQRVAVTTGIRWSCLCLLVAVPWSSRLWALPFCVVPVLSEKTCQKLKKKHRSGTQWAAWLLVKVRRWYPHRKVVLVGDGEYGTVDLIRASQQVKGILVGRLRWDASLWAFAGPQPKSKRGPKPKKGARQPSLRQRLTDPATRWHPAKLTWYGGEEKTVEIATGVCLWWTPGSDPVPLRWVLVRPLAGDPQPFPPGAFCCSDMSIPAKQIVTWFLGRHQIEVTFQEVRTHLGFETQRQWSVRAIERTTPCLFGLFSLVVLMAKTLHPQELPFQKCPWYPKGEAPFADALAAIRAHLWSSMNYLNSPSQADLCLIPRAWLQCLQNVACYAA